MWGFTKLFRDLGWQKFCSLNPMASEVTLYAPPPPHHETDNEERMRTKGEISTGWSAKWRHTSLPSESTDQNSMLWPHLTSRISGKCGQLCVCPAGWGAWIGCGYLPPYRCLPASIPTQSQNSTQRGVCLFLRLMIINNLRQEGRGQGVIVKSMTQLLRSGYNKNQLEPIRPKMAEDWISSGPWASVYTLCITLINDTPTSYMTVSGPRHQCCPSS